MEEGFKVKKRLKRNVMLIIMVSNFSVSVQANVDITYSSKVLSELI